MIRDIFRVFISSAFVQVLGAVRSFLLPVFLVPEQLGIWNLLNTIVGYGANSHIGLLHGMNKSIPRITADGDLVFRQSLKDSVFWINILLALLFSIAIAFFIFLKLSYSWQKAALVGAVIVIQSVYIYYLCLMRADSKFKAFSAISTFFSVILTAMVVGLVILVDDKVVGGLIGLLIAQLAVVVVLVKMTNYKFNFTVNWADIRHALSLGFPVLMIGLVDMVLLTLDRWLIVWRFTGKDLGI